ncbi:MAG: tetratricopeptide repeat protein, partial [Planctomycetota bacterium]
DGMPGGIPTARKAPAGTAALLTFKLDPELLFRRFEELMGTLLPGTETRLEPLLASALQTAGLDLRADFFEALGDEASLVLFAPAMIAAPPDWVMLVKVRNEERAEGLLAKVETMLERAGARIEFRPTEVGDGIPARRILLKGVPILPPTLAIHHGWMVCVSRPNLITEAVDKWGSDPEATLAGGSDSFQKTLRGLAGGESGNISLLAWLNLRLIVPLAFTATAGMIPPGFADTGYAPGADEIAPFFSGAAIAVRHDNRAVTLDTFSPFGVLIPGGIAGILAVQRFSRDMEGMIPGMGGRAGVAQNLNNQAWGVAKESGRTATDYQTALKLARAAVRLAPENAFYLNTLGVASYRAGEYEQALAILGKANRLNQKTGNYNPATDLLFLAMAHFQLGHSEAAHDYLRQSKELLQKVRDEELAGFLEEASRLIAPL